MARITLRLPEDLHQRLVTQSRVTGRSLNQTIVDQLEHRNGVEPQTQLTERERFIAALGDLVVPWSEDLIPDWPGAEDVPPLTDEDIERMPRLDPPLSESIIADREDRL
jgi:hypothetical protein